MPGSLLFLSLLSSPMDLSRVFSSASYSLLPVRSFYCSLAFAHKTLSTTSHFSRGLPFLRSSCYNKPQQLSNQSSERGWVSATRQNQVRNLAAANAASGSSSIMEGATKLQKDENLRVYESTAALTKDLAEFVAQLSNEAANKRGAFSVGLSGGSLISALEKLGEPPYVESIDWSRWHVFWVDERVVKKTHPDSNYKLACDGLLSKVAVPPEQEYAINDALSAEGAAEDYEAILKQLVKQGVLEISANGYPQFDLLLLGMGPDGHVASLFPGHPLVNEKQKWVAHLVDSPKPPPERITFTFPVINSAANILFVAMGSGKADMLQRVFGEEVPHGCLPAQEVFLSHGKLIWFTDKAASAKL
ncbi:hypothetical protein O6H91_20G070500 [Diphasiastrum complanatum]|uniref:Uncharacterized protein n=1 Tax=Diphasiastrum complanatum TaxID=34168 RepID=A0ACC2ARQ1_DIPCM|nr:hypothetical protein O6H91_20G070500 [Diphasiastrum complanatum]